MAREIKSVIVTISQTEQVSIDDFKDVKISREFDLYDSFGEADKWCKEMKTDLSHATISFTV